MKPFSASGAYYDLLYADKDYRSESVWLHELIQNHGISGGSVLELGCGTAIHAIHLAQAGYSVCGVDISDEMLERAQDRVACLSHPVAQKISLRHEDLRSIALDRTFDVVVALFHVISYQTANHELLASFKAARSHLNGDGLFVFDFWYGPAVLHEKPSVRVKRMENDLVEVTRIAEPRMLPNDNIVEVNYNIFVKDKTTEDSYAFHEQHIMRYLFLPEIEFYLEQSGFRAVKCCQWLSDEQPSLQSWGVCIVARAI